MFEANEAIKTALATLEARRPIRVTDESLETLGERLALPPFLEPQRARIAAGLKPI